MPTPTDPRDQAHPRKIVFDGTINAGHVLSIVTMLATVAVAWMTLDKRVVVLETNSAHQTARDAIQDAVIRDGITEVKSMLRDVQRSVDAVRDRSDRTGRLGPQ